MARLLADELFVLRTLEYFQERKAMIPRRISAIVRLFDARI